MTDAEAHAVLTRLIAEAKALNAGPVPEADWARWWARGARLIADLAEVEIAPPGAPPPPVARCAHAWLVEITPTGSRRTCQRCNSMEALYPPVSMTRAGGQT